MLKDCGDCNCAGWGVPNLPVVEDCSRCSNPGCMKKEDTDEGAKLLWCSHCRSEKYCLKECQSAHHKQHTQRCSRDMIRNINHKEEIPDDCGICMYLMTTANFEISPSIIPAAVIFFVRNVCMNFSVEKYTTVHTVISPGLIFPSTRRLGSSGCELS